MKRVYLFTLILTVLACMSMPVSATVVNGTLPDGKWQYNTETKELYIDAQVMPNYTSTLTGKGDYTFPDDKENPFGMTQMRIAQDVPWKNSVSSIRSIRFSHRIVKIGQNAFTGCYRLQKVTFGERAKEAGLIRIDTCAFYDCWALQEFDFSSVGVICSDAFHHAGFKYVELPAVTYLDRLCFQNCYNLIRKNTLLDDYDALHIDPSIYVTSPNLQTVGGHLCNYYLRDDDNDVYPILVLFGNESLFPKGTPYFEEKVVPGGVLSSKGTKPAYWYVQDGKRLILSGNEEFTGGTFNSDTDIPWRLVKYLSDVKQIYLYDLKTVAYEAFRDFTYVKQVQLNSGLFEIKQNAFDGCTALQKINLEAVSTIRQDAFNGCTALEVADMYNIVTIDVSAFNDCSGLRQITFGKNFSSIGNAAFKGAATSGANIYVNNAPPSKEKTGGNIFKNFNVTDSKLYVPTDFASLYRNTDPWKQFKQEAQTEFPYKADGWSLYESLDDNGNRKGVRMYISDKTILSKNYVTPDQTPWFDVRDIITDITVEESAGDVIGNNAFCGMKNLKGIAMFNGCTRIGKYAFKDCTSFNDPWFSDVNNDHLNADIELSAFENCTSLTGIIFGTKMKSIGSNAFHNAGLEKVYCLAKVPPTIQSNSFDYPELTELHVPQAALIDYIKAEHWNKFLFADVDSEHGKIVNAGKFYNGYYTLHADGYLYCSASESTGSVDLFGEDRYYFEKDVTELMVNGDLKYLGPVFANLPNLNKVTISSSVEKMDGTFSNCSKLLTVNLSPSNGLELGDTTFNNCHNLYTINMEGVTSAGKKCFYKCNNLRELKAPNLMAVDSAAFADCANLEMIDLGNAQMTNMRVVKGCTSLKTFIFNGTNIARYTFSECKALKSIYFGSNVATVFALDLSPATITDIHYTRPFPADVDKSSFNATNLPNIKLYVPKTAIDKFKTYDTWKEMDIQEDDSEEAASITLPVSGIFNDDHSSWTLDENGKLSISITGTQEEWPKGFDTYYDHPLTPWMPYVTTVEVSGENARMMRRLIFSDDNGAIKHDGGVKTIVFGEGVKYIGANFGYSLYYLTDVYCYQQEVPEVHKDAFSFTLRIKNTKPKLHVMSNLVSAYEAHEYWHYFDVVGDLEAPCYAVTLNAQFGKIEVQESDINLNVVPLNTVLHLNAIPDDGYKFVKWENYDPSTGLTVTKNITVTAVFAADELPDMEAAYVCDFTKKASNHGAYGDSWTYDNDWTVFGGANNNGDWEYAKMGGKEETLKSANPVYVVNKVAFDREIKAIRVSQSGPIINWTAITEWGVKVYKDLECTQLLYTVKGGDIVEDGTDRTYIISAEEGKPWSAGYAIQVYWNLSNESGNDGVFRLNKVEYMVSKDLPAATKYTVRFLNWDGTVLQSGEVAEGDMPAYKGDTPFRPNEGDIRYIFIGWDPTLDVVTADIDYTAQYFETTGLWNVQSDKVQSTKVLRDGMLLIERNGRWYNTLGAEVK